MTQVWTTTADKEGRSFGGIMGNVLDISSRLKSSNSTDLQTSMSTAGGASVVDIGIERDRMIKEDRRQVKRTILTEFISVHAVVPGQGVMRVILHDITENGLSFDLENHRGHFNVGEAVELRVYLNHQTYFKIETKVAHITDSNDDGFTRHGCVFVRDSANNEALSHFVKFLESVTASLRRDGGDVLVSKINS